MNKSDNTARKHALQPPLSHAYRILHYLESRPLPARGGAPTKIQRGTLEQCCASLARAYPWCRVKRDGRDYLIVSTLGFDRPRVVARLCVTVSRSTA